MRRRITLLLTCLSVALIATLLPLASLAEPPPPPSPAYELPTVLYPPPGTSQTDGRVAVLIELAEPLDRAAGAAPDGALQRQRVVAQAALLNALPAVGAEVLYQTRLLSNSIAVLAPSNQLEALRRLPGVARVSSIIPKLPAPSGERTSPDLSAAAAASAAATGRGTRIGIIDRGIDYTHADFGGPGTPAAYTANNPAVVEPGSFPTVKVVGGYDLAGDDYDASGAHGKPLPQADADPLECNRTNPAAPNPAIGQGTLVAGLAAGFGVAADGSTYRGPYGPGVDLSTLSVQPGVAPEAQIYALKVFGCHGSTALLGSAIERALDLNGDGSMSDQLDVLVISLGTPFGSPDDPDARAVDAAVRAGMVVVVAAGDTINTFYSVSSPASARLAIAVGASNGAAVTALSARGPLRGNDALKPDIVAPGLALRSAAVGTGVGAATLTGSAAAAPQVAGAAALLREQHPGWTPAQIKAALMSSARPLPAPPSLAGAGQLNLAGLASATLLAYGTDGGGLTYGAPWVARPTTAQRTLQLENTGDNDQIVSLSATAVATETGVTVTLPRGPIVVPAHGVAQATVELSLDTSGLEFSPDPATLRRQDNLPRHYLAEHGGSIQVSSVGETGTRVRPGHAAHFGSVDFYLDNQLLDSSLDSREVEEYVSTTPGQHMVIIRRPGASSGSTPIFSAPVNLLDGKDYTLLLVGRPGALGIVTVDETVSTPPPAGQGIIHFVNANRTEPDWDIGPLDVYLDGVLHVSRLAVGATSPFFPIAPGEHTVEFFAAGANPALERSKARKTFTVAAGEAILAGTGRHDDDDGDLTDDEQRAFIGRALPRLGGTLLANVPYNVFPTLASDAHVDSAVAVSPSARAFAAGIHNTGARNTGLSGTTAGPRTPLASAFELSASSPMLGGPGQQPRAADVQYLGVTSNYSLTQNLATTLIYFGLSTYGPWSTPNEVQFRVYIDSNRDGVDDFVLLNTNSGWSARPLRPATDVLLHGLYPLGANGALLPTTRFTFWGTFMAPSELPQPHLAPFNTSVMFQRATLADLALPLDPANPAGPKGPTPASFCYRVETRSRDVSFFEQPIDHVPAVDAAPLAACANRSGELLYDVRNYAVAPINTTNFLFGSPTTARPIFVDIDGGQITGGVNPAVLTPGRVAQVLVLHHHNTPFPQAEIVNVGVPITSIRGQSGRTLARLPMVIK